MMKNITITLDEQTAAWARTQAAAHDVSVSRLIGEILHRHRTDARRYDEALRQFVREQPLTFEWTEGRRPAREELHDRPGLRRY